MVKNAMKVNPSTTLRLALVNNGMELPYLLLSLWRLNLGLLSWRGSASASEEDRTLLRAVVLLPLPVISGGGSTATNGAT